jgi:hypothetical protein
VNNWRERHCQIVNTGCRIVGFGFVFVGAIFALWGWSLVMDPTATIDIDGIPSNDPWSKAVILIVGLVVCVLGVLLLFARPYKPKK